jgi:hypothetical protein
MFKSTRKRVLAALSVVGILVVAVAAYAYWTTNGNGSGTGTAGTDADSIVVTGSVSGLLYPGGPGRTVSFTAANPESFNQSISSIHLVSVDAYPTAADRTAGTNEIAGCGGVNGAAQDYQMSDVTVNPATDGDITPGATAQALSATGTLHMNNLDSNQDACKDAYLKLTFTSS